MSAGEKDRPPADLSGERRASPLLVLVEAARTAPGLVAIAALSFARDVLAGDAGALGRLVLAVAAILAGCLLLSLAVWRSRTWELTDEGVRMRRGLGWGPFSRRDLTIPYDHIHTVSMTSTALERVLGLATLDLDTGAAAAEGDASRVRGLAQAEAEALRAELFRRRGGALPEEMKGAVKENAGEKDAAPGPVPANDRPLATYALMGRDLVLAAASRMSPGSQAAALVVLLGGWIGNLAELGALDLGGVGADLAEAPLAELVPLVAGFLAVALLLGAATSFVVNLVRYAGHHVDRYADRVVVEHGLLSRSSRTLVAGRVQHVVVRQGLLRQLIGCAEVSAWVVAAPGVTDGELAGSVLLHPFVRMGELDAFLGTVLPSYAGALGRARLGRLGPAARRRALVRVVVRWLLVAALVALALAFVGRLGLLGDAAWLLRPLAVAAAVLGAALLARLAADALRGWHSARYGHTARELVLVTGGLIRLSVIAPRAHLQHMRLSASPLQRRARLASLSVRTAAGIADGLDLRDLPECAADELLAWFRPRRQVLLAKDD